MAEQTMTLEEIVAMLEDYTFEQWREIRDGLGMPYREFILGFVMEDEQSQKESLQQVIDEIGMELAWPLYGIAYLSAAAKERIKQAFMYTN